MWCMLCICKMKVVRGLYWVLIVMYCVIWWVQYHLVCVAVYTHCHDLNCVMWWVQYHLVLCTPCHQFELCDVLGGAVASGV
jgi:hypothetical protein